MKFDYLFLELSGVCNLKCLSCPITERGPAQNKFMPYDLFLKILNQVDAIGIRPIIAFDVYGETTLYPCILDVIDEVDKRGYKRMSFITNSTNFNETIARRVLTSNISRTVLSIYGWDDKSFDNFTRTKGLYPKVEKNIKTFLAMAADPVITGNRLQHIDLSVVPQEGHEKTLALYTPYVNAINTMRENRFGAKWLVVPPHIRKRARIFPMTMNTRQGKIGLYPSKPKKAWCYDIFRAMSIHCDGDVSFCCEDCYHEGNFGNINNNTLEEVWNSPTAVAYRKLYLAGKQDNVPLCSKCERQQDMNNLPDKIVELQRIYLSQTSPS